MNDVRRKNGTSSGADAEEFGKKTSEEKGQNESGEGAWLHYLAKVEDLAEKKSKIYSRLLIDPRLAQEMESLAVGHAQGKKMLLELAKKGKKTV